MTDIIIRIDDDALHFEQDENSIIIPLDDIIWTHVDVRAFKNGNELKHNTDYREIIIQCVNHAGRIKMQSYHYHYNGERQYESFIVMNTSDCDKFKKDLCDVLCDIINNREER